MPPIATVEAADYIPNPVQAVFGFSSPAALLNYSHNFNSDEPGPLLNPLPTCPKVSDDVHSALGRIDVHSALGQESWRSFNRPESGHGSCSCSTGGRHMGETNGDIKLMRWETVRKRG